MPERFRFYTITDFRLPQTAEQNHANASRAEFFIPHERIPETPESNSLQRRKPTCTADQPNQHFRFTPLQYSELPGVLRRSNHPPGNRLSMLELPVRGC